MTDTILARDTLNRFFRREGRLPSYREMSGLFGYASKNAAYKLTQKLIDEGVVEKGESGKLIPLKLSTPLRLLGSIQAGFPTPQEEDHLDTLSLDDYMVDKPDDTFLLRVFGDSMIDEGIFQGDLVIVEKGAPPKNGDIVVAEIDGEWTLKTYEKFGRQIRLVPGNKNYPPMYPQHSLTIGGVVRGTVRKYQ